MVGGLGCRQKPAFDESSWRVQLGNRACWFNYDGELAASVAGEVILWQIATFFGLDEIANYLSFSPDGTSLATTARDEPLLVWDVSEFY